MVTSNIVPDKKIVKMGDMSNSSVVPQRTLLGEVNEHITCPLCRGYYIDATTIVECLHSFCRSCIIKHLKDKSYCPVCEMMINSAKPNIKLDKALQDIVYKLVPGLFQKEMERRQHFYSSRPGPAASATPEQRGEDTERIIFSPEDVISFSLEYSDVTDTDSISSKSSDSNEPPTLGTTRRYLQCPAVVNISHLKKFLSMKFDIDSTQFAIEILYKRVPLSDYYTLMDIAYIYNWKRNEPMRFFYQIIDYVAIRNRIFDINRKSSHFRENKSSSAPTDDTNVNSPVPHLNDQGSEVSSGTDSPMPEENNMKQTGNDQKDQNKEALESINSEKSAISSKKNEEDVEKSQFLNSFELTAKSNCVPKTSPVKAGTANESTSSTTNNTSGSKPQVNSPKTDDKIDTLKRKYQTPPNTPELKKLKIELEKTKIPNMLPSSLGSSTVGSSSPASNQNMKAIDASSKGKEPESKSKTSQGCMPMTNVASSSNTSKEVKQQVPTAQQQNLDGSGVKRTVMTAQNLATSKRKPTDILSAVQQSPSSQKTISPLKIQMSKLESQQLMAKTPEAQKQPVKKMPDLKPSMPPPSHQNKGPPVNKVRMDLLANNSDPTIDRSKILNQVKTSLSSQNVASTTGGDPLKSLFDSCKINIPSSLSITLTDQKLDPRNAGDPVITDPKKNIVNKNLVGASNSLTHKIPSPPVHNYIEILKIPENDPKKPNKPETGVDTKSKTQNKSDTPTGPTKPASKSSESSAKGPVPNLKPIADTKLAKQVAANYSGSGPITFQQTFEQQIHTLTTDTKSKGPKTKAQVPKLVPATPKSFSAANKPGTFMGKPNATVENKSSTALDLSSPHSIQSPSGPQQTFDKAFETMQSIANLAKKQNLPPKGLQPSMSQSTSFPSMSNRPMSSGVSPLRIPSTSNINQTKLDKGPSGTPISNARQELNKPNPMKPANSSSPRTCSSPNYQVPPHASASNAQPSPRQTRSPSSSPKLVIAEEKQSTSTPPEQNMNQSNQITSTQFSNVNSHKSESPTAAAGPSKTGLKSLKPITPCGKLTGSRHPITPMLKPHPSGMSAADYLRPQFMHNALMRHQLEMNAAWMKAQRQYDFDLFKNMTNMAHHSQNDFNKDKQ